MKMMIVKQFEFEAAHFLPEHNGRCSQLHGHSYKLEIGVQGDIEEASGMVLDFGILKKIVNQEIIEHLDHTLLNSIQSRPGQKKLNFPWEMPTAENMVKWIKNRLQNKWEEMNYPGIIAFVRLWETSTSYAEWRRGD